MSRRRNAGLIVAAIALVLFLAWAGSAQARGLVPCGNLAAGEQPCNFCHLFELVDNIVDTIIFPIVPLIGVLMIAVGGVYLFFGGPSEKARTTGRSLIKNAIIGLIIVYAGWVIVGSVVAFFVKQADIGSFNFTATKGIVIQCNLTVPTEFAPPDLPPDSGRTAQCAPFTSGLVSVANLQNTCFGANADIASGVARAESGGVSNLPSRTDICLPGGEPVSWGLFQINISANTVGILNCPAAFDRPLTGSNPFCTVINRGLYNECVEAVTDPSVNIQTACRLSNNGTNWRLWGPRTRRVCGLP